MPLHFYWVRVGCFSAEGGMRWGGAGGGGGAQ